MNTLSSLLKFIGNVIKDTKTLNAVTLASNVTGDIKYIKVGKICVFSGHVNVSTELTSLTILATGLPQYYSGYGNIPVMSSDNNSADSVRLRVTIEGDLTALGNYSAASRSLRFSGAYLTN